MSVDLLIQKLNIYIVPPVLSLVVGLFLAIISIVKGKFRKENILFSLVCLWWSCLLSPAFICHHLFRGEEELLLSIERVIHFAFVYIPFVNMIYILDLLRIKRKRLITLTGVICFIFSVFTPTEYYFTGLHSYSWGYIAKGGIAFDAFGAFGLVVIIYLATEGFLKLRTETNYIMRIKIKYLAFSLVASGSLTMCNIPAINGIDFYPIGNLSFIPLSILAYGVLRFRLLDIRSILHITLVWAAISSIVVIPNVLLVKNFWSTFTRLDSTKALILAAGWFALNYVYLRKVQPLIDQLFNRRRFNLKIEASRFVESIAQLKTYGDLVREFTGILKRTLFFTKFSIINKDQETNLYTTKDGITFELNQDVERWFRAHNDLIEKSLVETDPSYTEVRAQFAELFKILDSEYILPFLQNGEIIGLMTMKERANLRQLTMDELRFLNSVKASTSIALANSIMYQNLTNYKNNLEIMVEERTTELQQARDALWGEMELAKKIQTVLLPEAPSIEGYDIAGYMKTTDLVGGDYYDVINTDGLDWLVIGDVSGHGVPAGLIMMMVQTSIHSVLATNNKKTPAELLETVNRVITKNIVKLQEEKYMTISVLACEKDGVFHVSGLHQDILVYRAETGDIEILPTVGMWIGVEEEIQDLNVNEKLMLNKKDALLLYSDGITEAWPKKATGRHVKESEMYGINGLLRAFGKSGHQTAEEIKTAVLTSLENYCFDDDATMLVVKRIG